MSKAIGFSVLGAALVAGGWFGFSWWVNQQVLARVQTVAGELQAQGYNATYAASPVVWWPGRVVLRDITFSGGELAKHIASATALQPVTVNYDLMKYLTTLTSDALAVEVKYVDVQKAPDTFDVNGLNVTIQDSGAFEGRVASVVAQGPHGFRSGAITLQGDVNAQKLHAEAIAFTAGKVPDGMTAASQMLPLPVPELQGSGFTIGSADLAVADPNPALTGEQRLLDVSLKQIALTSNGLPSGALEGISVANALVVSGSAVSGSVVFNVGKVTSGEGVSQTVLLNGAECRFDMAITMDAASHNTFLQWKDPSQIAHDMSMIPVDLSVSPCRVDSESLNATAEMKAAVREGKVVDLAGHISAKGPLTMMAQMMMPVAAPVSASGVSSSAVVSGSEALMMPPADGIELELGQMDGMMTVNGTPVAPLPDLVMMFSPAGASATVVMPEGVPTEGGSFMTADPLVAADMSGTMAVSSSVPLVETAPVPVASSGTVAPADAVSVPVREEVPVAEPVVEPKPQPEPKPKPKPKKVHKPVDPYYVPGIKDTSRAGH